MAELDDPGRRQYMAAVRKLDQMAPPFWIALRDLWCRWQHRGNFYSSGDFTWRCRLCDDRDGVRWKKGEG